MPAAGGPVSYTHLKTLGIELITFSKSIGPVKVPEQDYHFEEISENPFYMPNNALAETAAEYLNEMICLLYTSRCV